MSQLTFGHFVKLAQKLTIIYSMKGFVTTSWKDFEKFWFLLSSNHINHKRYISSNVVSALAALFFTHHYLQLEIGQCKRTVGCNLTPVIEQLKQPITDFITITIALNTYPEKKTWEFQNGGIFHFRQFLFQRCLS